jgi:hypothetical protein
MEKHQLNEFIINLVGTKKGMQIITAIQSYVLDNSTSLLNSLHKDLTGFRKIELLSPDVKTGLAIAIEQVERYIRDDSTLSRPDTNTTIGL